MAMCLITATETRKSMDFTCFRSEPVAVLVPVMAPMADAFTDYLRQIAGSPLLTTAEEIHLGTLIQRWRCDDAPDARCSRSGRRALTRVVTANLRLVVAVVKRSHARLEQLGVDPMDAIQAGNLGLIRAAQRFDPSRGYRFSTYAFWWVKESLNRFLHEQHSAIHIPANVLQLAFKVNALLAHSDSDRAASLEAIATNLNEKPERLRFALHALQRARLASLDQRWDPGESGSSLLDTVCDGRLQEPDDDYLWLHQVIQGLTQREQKILSLRFGSVEPVSLSHAADAMGLSRYQAQRLEQQALRKLREQLGPMLNPSMAVDQLRSSRSPDSHWPGLERRGPGLASPRPAAALLA
jgi:RNA polymerase primary sigma factor